MANIRPLSEPLRIKAEKELNEVPERIDEDLNALKTWIGKQPHLRCRMNDQFLVGFLRGCKFSLERAKEKIDLFYSTRTNFKELMTNWDPCSPKNMEIIKLGMTVPLPNTITPDGARLLIMRMGIYDPGDYDIVDLMRVGAMANDIFMVSDDQLMVAGQVSFICTNLTVCFCRQKKTVA
ncbi:hypothetical protein DMENIID0001_056260 [Sergentomyia squamirostris]